ncbi:MAG: hypothetical protein FWD68_02590 [Alphaproteobacteria bacterium]|nr:hypothetical protein [Alphaproteobacteria bacterium]
MAGHEPEVSAAFLLRRESWSAALASCAGVAGPLERDEIPDDAEPSRFPW